MHHRMAVRAQRDQILYRIKLVLGADRTQGNDVVDMDEPLGNLAINQSEVEFARSANRIVVINACGPSLSATLIGINLDLSDGALKVQLGLTDLLRECWNRWLVARKPLAILLQ